MMWPEVVSRWNQCTQTAKIQLIAGTAMVLLILTIVFAACSEGTPNPTYPSPAVSTSQTPDQQFINELRTNPAFAAQSDTILIANGHYVCRSFARGFDGTVIERAEQNGFNYSVEDAATLVTASTFTYCPQYNWTH